MRNQSRKFSPQHPPPPDALPTDTEMKNRRNLGYTLKKKPCILKKNMAHKAYGET